MTQERPKTRKTHYPCGHERTAENTQRVGAGNGLRCKTCRRAIGVAYRARKAERTDD